MILISLASKQIWPHVLAVYHLKPEKLFLLHSDNPKESRLPAERLKKFFNQHRPSETTHIHTEKISASDFTEIQKHLDQLSISCNWNPNDCILNITGGNKLMATAAFQWASRHGIRTFYLEWGNNATWFNFSNKQIVTSNEKIDGHIVNTLDPVALLRCQLDASEVEREGESLTLNTEGMSLSDKELFKHLQNGVNATKFLNIQGSADNDIKKGDALEFSTAAILLKLGVQKVQRSLRLKVKSSLGVSTTTPHAEIDLLFTWNGKLWLVDCKDRKAPESLVEVLRHKFPSSLSNEVKELLARIAKELTIGQTKALKEDLVAIREVGGLLGQVVCVRKTQLPEQVQQFAQHNHIELIQKSKIVEQCRSLLFPNHPPNKEQLAALTKTFNSQSHQS